MRDVSGVGDPLHLRIMNEGGVTWSERGLKLDEPSLLTSERPATKIINACRSTHEITAGSLRIEPANLTQDGPARIISIRRARLNAMLPGSGAPRQPAGRSVHGGCAMSQTSITGLPAVVSPVGSAAADLTHVVYTRHKNKRATLYINGQDRGVDIDGNFDTWDDKMPPLLGND